MKWQQTTLRKGTKSPKICRDMFIVDSRGKFEIGVVKNGKLVSRTVIDRQQAMTLIRDNDLHALPTIFNGCYTYRTKESCSLVNELLKTNPAA